MLNLHLQKDIDVCAVKDHLGWHDQGNGKSFYGLCVDNGRIKDEGDFRLKTALRVICGELKPNIRITPSQNILFMDLDPACKERLEAILTETWYPKIGRCFTTSQMGDGVPCLANMWIGNHRK